MELDKEQEQQSENEESQPPKNDETPQDRVSQSYVLKWGSIIGGLIVVIGIMLILSTRQGNILTGGAGATIPGILAQDTVLIERGRYHETIRDLRELKESHPELSSEINPILKKLQNLVQ